MAQINLRKFTDRLKSISFFITALILVALLFQKCNEAESLQTALKASQSETKHFKNELGRVSASNEVLVFQTKKQLREAIEKDKEFKAMAAEFANVKSTVKVITLTEFDTIREHFETIAPCEFERAGEIKSDWYGLGYKLNEKGLEIAPFKTWSDINVVTGFKRNWFLGKQTYYTDVTATNPYISIPEIQQKEVDVPTKWYQTTIFKIGLGVIGGVLIAK